ncbi:unnamed protein product, partial [Polarella glacialis]
MSSRAAATLTSRLLQGLLSLLVLEKGDQRGKRRRAGWMQHQAPGSNMLLAAQCRLEGLFWANTRLGTFISTGPPPGSAAPVCRDFSDCLWPGGPWVPSSLSAPLFAAFVEENTVQALSLGSVSLLLAALLSWNRIPFGLKASAMTLLMVFAWLPRPLVVFFQWCFDRKVLLGYFPPELAAAAVLARALSKDGTKDSRKPLIALTIDDAPVVAEFDSRPAETCSTSEIRRALSKHGAKATWFVIGSHAQGDRRPLLAELASEGHELANHGMVDRPAWLLGREEFAEDVKAAQAVVESCGGSRR